MLISIKKITTSTYNSLQIIELGDNVINIFCTCQKHFHFDIILAPLQAKG